MYLNCKNPIIYSHLAFKYKVKVFMEQAPGLVPKSLKTLSRLFVKSLTVHGASFSVTRFFLQKCQNSKTNMSICPAVSKFAKVSLQICPVLNKLKDILPNLVTLSFALLSML